MTSRSRRSQRCSTPSGWTARRSSPTRWAGTVVRDGAPRTRHPPSHSSASPGNVLTTRPTLLLRLTTVPGLGKLIGRVAVPKEPRGALNGLKITGHSAESIARQPAALAECYYHFPQLPHYLTSTLSLMTSINRLRGSTPRYRITAEQLFTIAQPVLYLWGTHDPFGSVETGRKIASLVPTSEFHTLTAGGRCEHARPMPIEHSVRRDLLTIDSATTAAEAATSWRCTRSTATRRGPSNVDSHRHRGRLRPVRLPLLRERRIVAPGSVVQAARNHCAGPGEAPQTLRIHLGVPEAVRDAPLADGEFVAEPAASCGRSEKCAHIQAGNGGLRDRLSGLCPRHASCLLPSS
jgi:hypothetical protein